MLVLLVGSQAFAQSMTLPVPDFHVHERECVAGTGGLIPCVELYEYRFDMTGMTITLELANFSATPGLGTVDVDIAITTSVNDPQDPFEVFVYTSVAGILGLSQTCDGWISPFTSTASARARVIFHPFAGTVEVSIPPLEADLSDLDGNDIVLTGNGLDCTIGVIDAALGAIPGLNLSVYDFVVDAVVPTLESGIEGLNEPIETTINNALNP